MPDAEKIVLLIRTALLTLNDAVQTGNFTVLRDVGAPGFREANSAARLTQTFSSLMSQHVDLSGIAITAPQLAEAPVIDPKNNLLRIKGWFPSGPLQINFALWFQPVAGRWRLFGISVNPALPTTNAPSAATHAPPARASSGQTPASSSAN